MRISTRRLTVHTRYPFRIARDEGSVEGSEVNRIIVRLEHDGTAGFGEAAPTAFYGQSLESVEATVERIANTADLLGENPFHAVPIMDRLVDAFDDQRATIAAVDAAIHDWIGRRLGLPVWQLLGLDISTTPPTSMTIGIDEPALVARKVDEANAFDVLKIKVGTDRDHELLSVVRERAPKKRIRLDANGAWTPETALERINALTQFHPEMIEQPIAPNQPDALREIHQSSPIPIFADEDCQRPADIPRLAGCVTGVNIKLAKCGGIREALRMIDLARAFDLKVMLGCMVETSLGISAAAQCASLVDLVDLDGHLLIADEPFDALRLEGDCVLPTDRPGLGTDASSLF